MHEFSVYMQISNAKDEATENTESMEEEQNAEEEKTGSEPNVQFVVDFQESTRSFMLVRREDEEKTGNPIADFLRPMNLLVHQEQEMDDSDIWSGRMMLSRIRATASEDMELEAAQFSLLYMSPVISEEDVLSFAEKLGYTFEKPEPGRYVYEEDERLALQLIATEEIDPQLLAQAVEVIGNSTHFAVESLDRYALDPW